MARVPCLGHYLRYHLQEEEVFSTRISDGAPLDLSDAKFVLRTERKAEDRSPAPDVAAPPSTARGRVRHPKFGKGIVVADEGDRLTVEFDGERRVVLRSFVTDVE
jgi:hypothetical protein